LVVWKTIRQQERLFIHITKINYHAQNSFKKKVTKSAAIVSKVQSVVVSNQRLKK
jgi:hypothetical protein